MAKVQRMWKDAYVQCDVGDDSVNKSVRYVTR